MLLQKSFGTKMSLVQLHKAYYYLFIILVRLFFKFLNLCNVRTDQNMYDTGPDASFCIKKNENLGLTFITALFFPLAISKN